MFINYGSSGIKILFSNSLHMFSVVYFQSIYQFCFDLPSIFILLSNFLDMSTFRYQVPTVMINHFSSKLLNHAVYSLSDMQRSYVTKYGLGKNLLNINAFQVPIGLLQWIVQHIHVGTMQFRHKNKVIQFTASMVQHVLGFPSGHICVSDLIHEDAESSQAIETLKSYLINNEMRERERLMDLLLQTHDEISFIRLFVLFSIATVIVPHSYVNVDYLNCLDDVSKIDSYDWNNHVLQCIGSEILKFQSYLDSCDEGYPSGELIFYGCLPLLAVRNFTFFFS